ncbi:Hypothetical predicted protein, partial [Pelobates cultripes]
FLNIRRSTQERNRSHVLNVENVFVKKVLPVNHILLYITEFTRARNLSHVLNV